MAITLIVIFVLIFPLFNSKTTTGDDYGFHVGRIKGVADGLKAHIFPVKIFHNMANTYSYGAGLFYCNFFLYFPAFLMLLNIPINIVIKIFMSMAIISMFVTTYIATKHISKNSKASILSSIMVVTSHYFRLNLYGRFAVGEYLAMIFLPLIIAGMWDFVFNDFKKPLYIIIGFSGVILSHTISTIFSVMYCILFCIINIKRILKNRKNIIKLIVCAILVALITMMYWLPMLEQMMSQEFKYKTSTAYAYDRDLSFVDLFSNNRFSLGYMQIILFLGCFFLLFKNWKDIRPEIKQMFLLASILLIPVFLKLFWQKFLILNVVQHPWRMLGLISILISMSFSTMVYKENDNIIVTLIIFSLLFCIMDVSSLVHYSVLSEDLYKLPNSLGSGKEFLPVNSIIDEGMGVDYSKIDFPNEAISDKNTKILGTKNNLTFEFKNNIEDENYLIPFFYYKGYTAIFIDNDGNKEKLNVSLGDGGLTKVDNIKKDGKIKVWYKETFLQKTSYIVSFGTILAIVVISIRKKRKEAVNIASFHIFLPSTNVNSISNYYNIFVCKIIKIN